MLSNEEHDTSDIIWLRRLLGTLVLYAFVIAFMALVYWLLGLAFRNWQAIMVWLGSVWQWLCGFSRLEWIMLGLGVLLFVRIDHGIGQLGQLLHLGIGLLQAANYRLDRMSYYVRHQEDEKVYQSISEWEKNAGD